MEAAFIDRLSAQSTLAELPAYGNAMELSTAVRVLDDTFRENPRLPGVVVTEGGVVRGAISRGQYLRAVSRYLGHEIYFPRPLSLMFDAVESMERPMILPRETAVQEAVRRALGRPRELVYEPVIVGGGPDKQGALRLIDFQDLLMADSRISMLRNRQMSEILSTVQEGFLLVDREHRVASEYSRSIEALFGHRQIAGRRLPALLAELLAPDRAELGRDYLETLFNPNVIERLVTQINPLRRVRARPLGDRGARHLAFRFQRSVEAGVIRNILVRVEDTTREVELAAEVEAQQRKSHARVDLALSLVEAEPAQLAAFLAALDRELAANRGLDGRSAEGPVAERLLAAVLRRLHALKGEAGMLRLKPFQEEIHELEERLAELRTRAVAGSVQLSALAPGFRRLRELAAETRSVIQQFKRLGSQGEDHRGADAERRPADGGVAGRREPATEQLFQPIARLVSELAERLGKPARFYTRVVEHEVPAEYRGLLRETLAQLARNAMIHGLEPAAERRRLGKPEVGTLQVALRQHPRQRRWEFVFQDDGAGLDLDKISRRARELGLGNVRRDELAQLIFRSGFSTASETTVDAGRGVGMDMVRSRIAERGGVILPHSKPGVFCAFQILLPI